MAKLVFSDEFLPIRSILAGIKPFNSPEINIPGNSKTLNYCKPKRYIKSKFGKMGISFRVSHRSLGAFRLILFAVGGVYLFHDLLDNPLDLDIGFWLTWRSCGIDF